MIAEVAPELKARYEKMYDHLTQKHLWKLQKGKGCIIDCKEKAVFKTANKQLLGKVGNNQVRFEEEISPSLTHL